MDKVAFVPYRDAWPNPSIFYYYSIFAIAYWKFYSCFSVTSQNNYFVSNDMLKLNQNKVDSCNQINFR